MLDDTKDLKKLEGEIAAAKERVAVLQHQLDTANNALWELQQLYVAAGGGPSRDMEWNPNLFMRVEDTPLSKRVKNAFKYWTIKKGTDFTFIWQLVEKTEGELLEVWNIGPGALKEVRGMLADLGCSLRMKLPPNFPRNRRE
jgi:DNA-directed RNA polymerase subunit alpha